MNDDKWLEPPAAYPMVDESAATGRVAVVYATMLESFPMVPSLFKSLAVCPGYLELAWEQAQSVLDADGFARASDRLVTEAAAASPAPEDRDVRELTARFVQPLAQMLLVAAGLRLALDGDLTGPPADPSPGRAPGPLRPDLHVPTSSQVSPGLVGAIRADLATPLVNSIWRVAADRGLLDRAWRHFGPATRRPGFADAASRVSSHARAAAQRLRWPAVADSVALRGRDLADAGPGAAAILEAYLITLPRVLTLAASSHHTDADRD